MLPNDHVLDPQRLIPVDGHARRLQTPRPVTRLRMIKNFSTALRNHREKQIALAKLKVELTLHPGVDIHQLDPATELLATLPHAIDFNEPDVLLRAHDLPREDILSAVEAFLGSVRRT